VPVGLQKQLLVDDYVIAEKHSVTRELGEVGKVVPGFSGGEAKKYKGVDELRLKPQWKSGGDLSRLKGRTVKLRFTLRNTKLYAFDFN